MPVISPPSCRRRRVHRRERRRARRQAEAGEAEMSEDNEGPSPSGQHVNLELSTAIVTELSIWIEEQPAPKPTIKPTMEQAAVQALEKWADWRGGRCEEASIARVHAAEISGVRDRIDALEFKSVGNETAMQWIRFDLERSAEEAYRAGRFRSLTPPEQGRNHVKSKSQLGENGHECNQIRRQCSRRHSVAHGKGLERRRCRQTGEQADG